MALDFVFVSRPITILLLLHIMAYFIKEARENGVFAEIAHFRE